jgi:hypothetical protein
MGKREVWVLIKLFKPSYFFVMLFDESYKLCSFKSTQKPEE